MLNFMSNPKEAEARNIAAEDIVVENILSFLEREFPAVYARNIASTQQGTQENTANTGVTK